jgi:hypothetical protein
MTTINSASWSESRALLITAASIGRTPLFLSFKLAVPLYFVSRQSGERFIATDCRPQSFARVRVSRPTLLTASNRFWFEAQIARFVMSVDAIN